MPGGHGGNVDRAMKRSEEWSEEGREDAPGCSRAVALALASWHHLRVYDC